MSYHNYSEYFGAKGQNNIMVLVGNGFDIQSMLSLGLYKQLPTYENFYDFLLEKKTTDPKIEENIIFQKMSMEKEKGNKLWSDFEVSLIDLKINDNNNSEQLLEHLDYIQLQFSNFINKIVQVENLYDLGHKSETENLALNGISSFVKDLSVEDFTKSKFFDKEQKCDHYRVWNYLFINFNYTHLLDSYMSLDKKKFDPNPFKTVKTNFRFVAEQGPYPWIPTGYVNVDIIHPHGIQNIPQSIVFGVDNKNQLKGETKSEEYLTKTYWSRNDVKYKHYFNDTDLFIIYGHSLGITDQWWWDSIVEALIETDAELIIYNYIADDEYDNVMEDEYDILQDELKRQVVIKFLNSIKNQNVDTLYQQLQTKISVILFNENKVDRSFLRTRAIKKE